MQSNNNNDTNIIKFKSTNTTHDLLELEFSQNKTVLQYKQTIGQLYDYQPYNVKLVFKGKVLSDKEKAGQLGLKNNTVMMVLNKPKKPEKPTLSSAQQTIPKTNLSTGLGSSSPVGFGGYGIMNHPGYMSAISSAVDQQKVQQMMNDPYYQSMIQQMLDDPDTLKQLMQQNPMTKQLIDQNPMMKMVMSNPALMKMVLNKDTMKMAMQMQKNGNVDPQALQNGSLLGSGGLGGLSGLNAFSAAGSNLNNPATSNTAQNSNPFGSMMGNPFFPMMGSGFGNNQGMNFPNNQGNSFLSNPFLGFNAFQNPQNTSSSTSQNNSGNNLYQSMFTAMQNAQQKSADQSKYSVQIKQLGSMGFSDKQKCIKYLKETNGDIDSALQKLCLDDDQNQKKQQKKE